MKQTVKRNKSITFYISRRPTCRKVRSREPPSRVKVPGTVQNRNDRFTAAERFFIKLGVIVAFCIIIHFFAGIHIHHGNRMYPFIMDGDLLIIFRLSSYTVGDAVLYRNPETEEKEVSRITAAGRNEILITEEGQFLINRFSTEGQVFYLTQPLEGSPIRYPYQMEEGGYFLLDDFRTQGSDSRSFGQVTDREILGKVIYVFRRRGI